MTSKKETGDLEYVKKIVDSFTKKNDGYTMMGTSFCDSMIKATGGCPSAKASGEVKCPSFMKCLTKSISTGAEVAADLILTLPLISDDNEELRSRTYATLIEVIKTSLSASRSLVFQIFIDAERKVEKLNSSN